MTAQVVAGTRAVQVANPTPNNLFIQILSASGNLYYKADGGVSPTNYDGVLGVNGTLTRLPGVDTWVCTDLGARVQFNWDTTGTLVNPGTVLIDGPIDANIIGPVDVNIGTSVNVVPINQGTQLGFFPGVLSTFASSVIYNTGVSTTALNGISTIQIASKFSASSLTPSTAVGAVAKVEVTWYGASGTAIDRDEYAFLPGARFNVRTPIKGIGVDIRVTSGGVALTNQDIVVLGYVQEMSASYSHYMTAQNGGAIANSGGTDNGSYDAPYSQGLFVDWTTTAGTQNMWPSVIAGEATIQTRFVNAAASLNIRLFTLGYYGDIRFYQDEATTALTNNPVNIIIPNGPLMIQYAGTVGQRNMTALSYKGYT